jgi:aspartate ammonia-lyase
MKDNPYLVVRVHKNTGAEAHANFSNSELIDQIAANKKTMEDYLQASVEIQQKLREVPRAFDLIKDQTQGQIQKLQFEVSKTRKEAEGERDNLAKSENDKLFLERRLTTMTKNLAKPSVNSE